MQDISGGIWPRTIDGVGLLTRGDAFNQISINTQSALLFFKRATLLEPDIDLNQLGLFSHVQGTPGQPARFASLSTPKHVFSNRKNGCVFIPKGGSIMRLDEVPMCPKVADAQICPDAFYGDCMEGIFGAGNGILKLPEEWVLLLLQYYYEGMGNSLSEMVWYSNHPDIETANTNGTYLVSEEEWDAYYDQQMSGTCSGLMTILDALKAEGLPQFNDVTIPDGDIDANGKYTGDIIQLFEDLIAAAPPVLKAWIKNGATVRNINSIQSAIIKPVMGRIYPVILATSSEFAAYKAYLAASPIAIVNQWNFILTGRDGDIIVKNVLQYGGMPVVEWDEVSSFDAIVGTDSHRVAIIAPGALGIVHDVSSLMQFKGMGLIVQQSNLVQDKGLVRMTTNFQLGTAILDPEFIVAAFNINPS